MNAFPKDPIMLLSAVNMKLRDEYDSLSALCDDCDCDENELKATLSAVGYEYDEKRNQFI